MSIAKKVASVFFRVLASKKIYLVSSLSFKQQALSLELKLDFVRYRTLELCVEELKYRQVAGQVAEVGVFKGEFAKLLNRLLPDRKLYLFDTFEGFDPKDVSVEHSSNFSEGNQDFSDTSVDAVLAKMMHPKQCIVKKGYFPQTAEGVEERFCFVSLDADLYKPIYDGLHYFYPRLEKGGYIFIHDYNNDAYKGAREALRQFCKEQQLSFVPIIDSGGTAILTK
jgi:O-methyltransferase